MHENYFETLGKSRPILAKQFRVQFSKNRTVTVRLLLSNIGVGDAKLPHRTQHFDMSII